VNAASFGDLDAQNKVGVFFYTGRGATATDYRKASEYFHLASLQGQTDGIFNIGLSYERGSGVAYDISKAYQYYQHAAKKEMTRAQNWLEERPYPGSSNQSI